MIKKFMLGVLLGTLGILTYWSLPASNSYIVAVLIEDHRVVPCQQTYSATLSDFIESLNTHLKKRGIECSVVSEINGDTSTVQCAHRSGRITDHMYWSSTKKECERVYDVLKSTGKF